LEWNDQKNIAAFSFEKFFDGSGSVSGKVNYTRACLKNSRKPHQRNSSSQLNNNKHNTFCSVTANRNNHNSAKRRHQKSFSLQL